MGNMRSVWTVASAEHMNETSARRHSWSPFGGVKDSGHGDELAGPAAASFTNAKTVRVSAPTGATGGRIE